MAEKLYFQKVRRALLPLEKALVEEAMWERRRVGISSIGSNERLMLLDAEKTFVVAALFIFAFRDRLGEVRNFGG